MSRLTDAVKVPMIILVIFVHENLNLEADGRWGLLLATVANVAVPTFFMISGYYFFKGGVLNRGGYAAKLRKRCRTLLVPYLLWNLVPMANIVAGNVYSIIFRGKSTEALQEYFTGLWHGGVWRVWWNITSGTMPYDSPLWYVRDLMVMCLVSPLIYLFIRRAALPGVVLLLALFVCGVDTGVTGLSMAAVTFFVLGGYFSLNGSRVEDPGRWACRYRRVVLAAMAVSLALRVALAQWEYSDVFGSLAVVSGVFASYSLTAMLPEGATDRLCVMSSAVFFVYALHNTSVLSICGGVMGRLQLPHGITVFVTPFVAFAVCYAVYLVVRRLFPRLLAVACGGRA